MGRNKKTDSIQEIADALDTPVNMNWCDVAEELSLTIPDLQERFSVKLNDSTVFAWDTIPAEHQPVVDAIARDLESEASVRRLEAVTSSLPEVTEETTLPPILEEPIEQPKKRKKQSSALTKKKTESLKNSDQNSQQLAAGDVQIKQALHVKKGQKSGAQLATLELAAEDVTYRRVKGEALIRKVAQLSSEMAAESGFDPIQILQEMGVECNDEIFEELRQQVEPALGKIQSATAEIVESAWLNGIDLQVELGNLENLLSSNSY